MFKASAAATLQQRRLQLTAISLINRPNVLTVHSGPRGQDTLSTWSGQQDTSSVPVNIFKCHVFPVKHHTHALQRILRLQEAYSDGTTEADEEVNRKGAVLAASHQRESILWTPENGLFPRHHASLLRLLNSDRLKKPGGLPCQKRGRFT